MVEQALYWISIAGQFGKRLNVAVSDGRRKLSSIAGRYFHD
jgi:hypothetical protein